MQTHAYGLHLHLKCLIISHFSYICLYFYSTFPNVSHFNPHKGKTEDLQFPFPPHPSPVFMNLDLTHPLSENDVVHTRGLFLKFPSELCCMTDDPMSSFSASLSSRSIPSTFFFFFLYFSTFIDYSFHFLLPPVEIIHWLPPGLSSIIRCLFYVYIRTYFHFSSGGVRKPVAKGLFLLPFLLKSPT